MASLTDSSRALIETEGGIITANDELVIFTKTQKPSRKVKKMLKDLGYIVTPKSGGKFYPYIEYEFPDKNS